MVGRSVRTGEEAKTLPAKYYTMEGIKDLISEIHRGGHWLGREPRGSQGTAVARALIKQTDLF